MTTIITVPHATCPRIPKHVTMDLVGHICDFKAKEFAEELQQALVKHGHKAILLVAGVSRKECDINRPECRTMSFRPRLTKLYCEFKAEKNKTWVIDIHSFPKKEGLSKSFGRNDIAVLDIAKKRNEIPGNVNQLVRRLKENVNTKIYQGTLDNYILREARDWGYFNSTLIEINEGISQKEMKQAINAIVDTIRPSSNESCLII